MKRTIKSIAGVTLLEIMLVLAIAAMVITMSVKYYSVANNSAHLNDAVEQIQSIAAAADGIAAQTGSFTSAGNSAGLSSVLPSGWQHLPWGASVTVTSSATSMTIAVPSIPGQICTAFISRIISNSHFSSSATCSTTANTATSTIFTYVP
jgi:type II secretory pathway pseudopilin PulG